MPEGGSRRFRPPVGDRVAAMKLRDGIANNRCGGNPGWTAAANGKKTEMSNRCHTFAAVAMTTGA